ncbi:putative pyrroloquinoline-quinone binding quinoprotein [Micromonospora sp. Llam0]|uniref:Hsp70 family protein n=1 Tax=Micromonospora sp. Llam0 TaxID=2485143 RepID=UPI000F472C66|nr:Hsp70 family protein [Micromonospora sp. Llam0]ROO51599.1 putative pyrroloquinoline-quinone binding quinoprotein [Micromonospora sp. Llam0]
MTGQDGGFALGVDLGTSNTVAVLRWPDGRTRPLLFDGAPILPSGVFLGDRLYVGRDALRLAQSDPARFEPNPKRRIDESTVLLGDHEVPTADLLAAVLAAVARAAVEAVGFLPPAALTYPAAWGSRRREVLAQAVARAGWPPVAQQPSAGTRLVPEPVAAARYFADVLRRPVPVGQALAVFDFGGGTLDIAVVRNDGVDSAGRARFAVIGSGGIAELGGLDLDAALVEHLGGVLDPQVAQQLNAPASPAQWRNRRQFWDDVRGAKEMLSRSSSAPVAVPGVDQAVHLTRDELEQVATPLIRRGVREAARVIADCGLGGDQLAGLFLVGGSSRVPLAARLLHSELGVAPTVLEQPELPVAEGALADLATVAAPAPVPPAPSNLVSPAVPTAQMPAPPPAAAPPPASASVVPPPGGPPAAGRSRRGRLPWLVGGAVLALTAVVAATVVYLLRDPAWPIEFRDFTQVGSEITVDEDADALYTQLVDGRAYGGFVHDDGRLGVVAIDPGSGEKRWEAATEARADRWSGLLATPAALVAVADASSSTRRPIAVLDPADGRQRWKVDVLGNDQLFVFDDVLVWSDVEGAQLVGLDLRDGTQRWAHANPADQYDDTKAAVYAAVSPADVTGPAGFDGQPVAPQRGDDRRIVQITANRQARVFDAKSGELLGERPNVAGPNDTALVYDGKLLIAPYGRDFRLAAYDLDTTGEPVNLYTPANDQRRLQNIVPCGAALVCLLESQGFSSDTNELVVVDLDEGGVRWRAEAADFSIVVPVGEHILLRRTSSDYLSRLLDAEGNEVLSRAGVAVRIDRANLLWFRENPASYPGDTSVAGLAAGTPAEPRELGVLGGVRTVACSWDRTSIVCPTSEGFAVHRFVAD